jgi:UrcA family protein
MSSLTSRFTGYRRTSAALTALAACLLVGASGAAQAAAPADALPTVTVRYGDLNLGTEQGTSALYARIVFAARQVCFSSQVDHRDLKAFSLARACETRAIAQAVHDVNSPRLAALYGTRLRHG